ncbi:hypothetical protein B0H13DRAFT_2387106 [Mycena leptocephala]|nr:hypothetical protein B0H13DRAFT_2387106 [Mycena leptocephala]
MTPDMSGIALPSSARTSLLTSPQSCSHPHLLSLSALSALSTTVLLPRQQLEIGIGIIIETRTHTLCSTSARFTLKPDGWGVMLALAMGFACGARIARTTWRQRRGKSFTLSELLSM